METEKDICMRGVRNRALLLYSYIKKLGTMLPPAFPLSDLPQLFLDILRADNRNGLFYSILSVTYHTQYQRNL